MEMVELVNHKDCKAVIFCGHSLGAAVQQLCAIFFLEQIDVSDLVRRGITVSMFGIGQPRTGNEAWINFCAHTTGPLYEHGLLKAFRIIDNMDIVAMMPPVITGFRHFGIPMTYLKEPGTGTVL